MIIDKPGVYDIDADTYHRDPCPQPSLSAGMINDLMVAPAKCKENSQRLNPDWEEPEGAEKFTIGSVSHVMFLEPHLFDKKVTVCPYDDWRKGEAKEMRAAAKLAGKTPILSKHMDKVKAARSVFMSHGFTKAAFTGGKFEQSLFWKHPRHGFWCRARPDFIADSLAHLCDYKATANADPAQFGRHAYNMGYYRRAAWYLGGIEAVFGKRPDHYWFCNQETKKPYLPAVVELDMGALADGEAENAHAAGIFARCLVTNDWYGYRHRNALDRDRAFTVSLPPWSMMEIDRRLARDIRNTASSVRLQYEEEVE